MINLGIIESKNIDTTPSIIPLDNIISQYKFEDNVLDTVGSNDGTPTAITYIDGLVGRSGVFNGSNSKVVISDSDDLSFTDGVNDLPFSISMLLKINTITDINLIDKSNSSNREYRIVFVSNVIYFILFDTLNTNQIRIVHTMNLTLSQWYHLTFTYIGNGSNTGLEMYIDGLLVTVTRQEVNVYNKMNNYSIPLSFGYDAVNNSNFLNGQLDCVRIWDKELSQEEITQIATDELNGIDINP